MCIKTALRASSLCMIPALIGFGAGTLSVTHPKLFLGALCASVLSLIFVGLRSYSRVGTHARTSEVDDVEVTAGAMLALSFMFSFWTGLCWIGGHGIVPEGALVAASTGLLAAFTLTFVRRVIDRKVKWVDSLVGWLLPATRISHAESV